MRRKEDATLCFVTNKGQTYRAHDRRWQEEMMTSLNAKAEYKWDAHLVLECVCAEVNAKECQ